MAERMWIITNNQNNTEYDEGWRYGFHGMPFDEDKSEIWKEAYRDGVNSNIDSDYDVDLD